MGQCTRRWLDIEVPVTAGAHASIFPELRGKRGPSVVAQGHGYEALTSRGSRHLPEQ